MNGASQRADVVVIGQSASPVLVVECKAPDVGLDSEVLGQAVRYNSVLAAPYVMITNGMSHRIYQRSGAGYVSLQELPPLF